MPRDSGTGIYTRVSNTFSEPVIGDIIEPTDANELWDDLTDALNDLPSELGTFLQAGTGAVERTGQSKMRDIVSVKDFGAACDGVTDDLAAWNAALAAHDNVFLPLGTSIVSGPIVLAAGKAIDGASRLHSVIKTSSATADVLTMSGGFNRLHNFSLSSTPVRSGGYFINMTGGNTYDFSNLTLNAPFEGIRVAISGGFTMSDVEILSAVATSGISIRIVSGVALMWERIYCVANTSFRPFAHLFVQAFGDLSLSDSHFIGAGVGGYFAPGTGELVAFFKGDEVFFDNNTNGIFITPSSTGNVSDFSLENSYVGANTTIAVNIAPSGTSLVDGVRLENCSILNGSHGVSAVAGAGTTLKNISITGGYVSNFSVKGTIFTDVNGVQLDGAHIGAYAGSAINATGIELTGTTQNIVITGGSCIGNTSNYSNTSGSTPTIKGTIGLTDSPVLPVVSGGSGAATVTGLLQGNGTSAFTAITDSSTVGQVLRVTGASAYGWGALNLGTAAAITGTLPVGNGGTGITALGTGVATALGVNVGSAGAFVTFNGAGGTPSSLTLTSATGLPISTGVSGLGTGIAAALAVNTGSAGAPVLFNGAGGTPSSLTLTNATSLPFAGLTAVAWTNYTPTVTATVGTFTSVTGNGWYSVIGKIAHVAIQVVCTTVGTAAGNIRVTLPSGVDIKGSRIGIGNLYNITAGYGGFVVGGLVNATSADCYKYDGTFPITTGQTCWMMFIYEMA